MCALDRIDMDKIYIQDANDHRLSFDLKDLLTAIGLPALEAFWTVGPVERTGEPLEVVGKDIRLIEALAASGERVSGYRLQEIAADIHQTIWGEFRGYETSASLKPWVIMIAFDSTWFEVHSADVVLLRNLRAKFKNTLPPVWSRAWTS
jgi:hypothetical protein